MFTSIHSEIVDDFEMMVHNAIIRLSPMDFSNCHIVFHAISLIILLLIFMLMLQSQTDWSHQTESA
ncbi:hypothetical protein [Kingella negevensis]|uniref:hypothetical protein n=1 Tax=Kingella negevensis TaxID=1522312 RepID=UPI00050A293A|nr:hypothetical protein [Kingella negevensis]MDK4687938.1 hypothetical protein [Kingella negevensis]